MIPPDFVRRGGGARTANKNEKRREKAEQRGWGEVGLAWGAVWYGIYSELGWGGGVVSHALLQLSEGMIEGLGGRDGGRVEVVYAVRVRAVRLGSFS